MSDKVMAALEPVLASLGAEDDPPCWVAWGDDPRVRYLVLALTGAGLATCHVRVSVPQEGPRAAGKLVRWNRVQVGELSVEHQAGHTMLGFQVEGTLLRGVDDECPAITEFAMEVLAAIDGRPVGFAARVPRPLELPALPAPRAVT